MAHSLQLSILDGITMVLDKEAEAFILKCGDYCYETEENWSRDVKLFFTLENKY